MIGKREQALRAAFEPARGGSGKRRKAVGARGRRPFRRKQWLNITT